MSDSLTKLLRTHTCLFASFETGIDAEVSRGPGEPIMNPDVVRHDPSAGRHGGALVFAARDHGWAEDELTFAACDNFPYSADGFEGSIALWAKGDPDRDLHPQFPVDLFHISRHAADASFYLDLTKPNDWRYGSPRKLRFGFYNDSPARDMFQGGQLLVVGDLHWNDDRWHHVVATWKHANSGADDGYSSLSIDGVLRCWMEGYRHQLTWDIDNLLIGLGQRYVGCLCDFLVLDKCLPVEMVTELFQHGESLRGLY